MKNLLLFGFIVLGCFFLTSCENYSKEDLEQDVLNTIVQEINDPSIKIDKVTLIEIEENKYDGFVNTTELGSEFQYAISVVVDDDDFIIYYEDSEWEDSEPQFNQVGSKLSENGAWSDQDIDMFYAEMALVAEEIENTGLDKDLFFNCFLEKLQSTYTSFAKANQDEAGCEKLSIQCALEMRSY
jgi:hypothetical protein